MKILPKNKDKKPHPSKIKAHGKKGEQIVIRRLLNLNSEEECAKLINDLILIDKKGNSHQIDHIVIRPNGVFVIETKNWGGLVLGKEDDEYWTVILDRKSYVQYNPVMQNKEHCRCVDSIIGDICHPNSVIAMMGNNGKKLGIHNVVNGCSLRRYIREFNNGIRLTNEEIDIIYADLIEASSDLSLEQHIQNIANRKA